MTIYLSGRMSGLEDYGAALFRAYAERYRAEGFTVLSPPEMDADMFTDDKPYTPQDYRQCLHRDADVLLSKVDRIYLLPNWRQSKGASYERYAAQVVGIPVYSAETGEPMTSHLTLYEVNGGRETLRVVPEPIVAN